MFYVKMLVVVGAMLIGSCTRPQPADSRRQAPLAGNDTGIGQVEKMLYTCPMHSQVRLHSAGKCPVCGMPLVPVENDKSAIRQSGDTGAPTVVLSLREQQLAGIRIDTAKAQLLKGRLVLTGTTIFDPRRQHVISARVGGWIKRMYVRNPGERIVAGQKLYDVYSPELLAAEKDYVLAKKQRALFQQASVDFTATLQAMKQKLLRWGLSEADVDQLTRVGPTGQISICSKVSGYMIQKDKEEGDAVKEGETLMRLADNNTLWVQAQGYDQELSLLNHATKIMVELPAFPGQQLTGALVFRNPVNEQDGQLHLLNIAIANPEGQIQTGMLADVYVQTSRGISGTVVPKSSVIYGEKANYVWLAGEGQTFVRRKVTLGTDNASLVAVRNGIQPGEKIVSGGTYLLNSAYTLRYGTGTNRMGMQMSDMKMKGKNK